MADFNNQELDSFFNNYYNNEEAFSTNLEGAIPRTIDLGDRTYTRSKLLEDQDALNIIKQYESRFHGNNRKTDEELVDDYLARMRKFSAGQSVVTLNELRLVTSAEENDKLLAGQAYDVFERMEGFFDEDYTWKDRFDAFGTYARAMIVDPTNLIGLGVGRLVGGGATKAASVATREVLKAATVQSLKELGRKELASRVASEGLELGARLAGKELGVFNQAATMAERTILRKELLTAPVETAIKNRAMRGIAATTLTDSALAVGVDVAYQNALIKSGEQEEWSPFQTGISALAGVVGGVLDYSLYKMNREGYKEVGKLFENMPARGFKRQVARKIAEDVSGPDQSLARTIDTVFTSWESKWSKGVGRNNVDMEAIWKRLILGDDEKQVKGLAHLLYEKGVVFSPRTEDDNATSFFIDILRGMKKAEKGAVARRFNQTFGQGNQKVTFNQLMNDLSLAARKSGQFNEITSRAVRTLNLNKANPNKLTAKEMLDSVVRNMDKSVEEATKPQNLKFYQDKYVQIMVSHPATTALNVIGSTWRAGMEVGSDIVEALIYGGRGLLTGSKTDILTSKAYFKSMGRLVGDLVHSEATMENVKDYLTLMRKTQEELNSFGVGGINLKDFASYNLDKSSKLNQRVAKFFEGYKDFAQTAFYVRKQDDFFKTQAFWYSLNKNMLAEFGQDIRSVMDDPVALMKLAQTDKFNAVQLKSIDDAMLMTFSKAYSREKPGDSIQKIFEYAAKTIEGISDVPFFGAALPFGRFFNNTIDMMADFSGGKLLYRTVGRNLGNENSYGGYIDAISKAAVGWGLVFANIQSEKTNIELGLSINQEMTSDGEIIDRQFDFPYSPVKYIARLFAHKQKDKYIPPELWDEVFKNFGIQSFTRQSSSSLDEFNQQLKEMINSEAPTLEAAELFFETIGGIAASWVSGYTRPLDVVNELAATVKGEKIIFDRKSGSKIFNEAVRYLDQVEFVNNAMEWFGAIESQSATQDQLVTPVSRIVGWRTVSRQSDTQKMMNRIGRPEWMIKPYEFDPRINNRMAELLQDNLEFQASILVNSKRWENMNIDQKRQAANDVLKRAREATREDLERGMTVEDRQYSLIRKLEQTYNDREIKTALKSYGLTGTELIDLAPAQLLVLDTILQRQKRGLD